MRTITNHYQDLEVWNLDPWSGQRGPFLVVQTGMAPGDDQLRERLFVLRPDGQWVDIHYYAVTADPELMDQALFTGMPQIMTLLDKLPAKPEVADLNPDEESLRAWLTRTAGSDPVARLRLWLEQYKQRRRDAKA